MRVAMNLAVAFLGVAAMAACASDGSNGGSSGTDASTTGADTQSTGCTPADLGGACNPLCDDTGCGEGTFCTLGEGGLACLPVGTQPLGISCNQDNPCAEGACVSTDENNARCRAFCADDTGCDPEDQCNPLADTDPPISVCVPRPEGCSVFQQNCEDATQACTLNGCVAPGTAVLGDECGQDTLCVKGLVCARDAADKERCHEPCNPNTGGPNPKCHLKCPGDFAELIGADGKSTGVGVCQLPDEEEACDLMAHNCEAGQACYMTSNGPRCRPEGATPVGGACSDANDCEKGSVCWPLGTANRTCKAVCDPSEPTHAECDVSTSQCPAITQNAGYCDE